MNTITVRLSVDRASAILAGNAQYGDHIMPFDPSTLSVEERVELVTCQARADGALDLFSPLDTLYSVSFSAPKLAAIDSGAVQMVLGQRIAQRAAYASKKAAQDAEIAIKVRAWLDAEDDSLVVLDCGRVTVIGVGLGSGVRVPAFLLSEVDARMAHLHAIAKEKAVAYDAARQSARAAEAERLKGIERAKADQIAAWVAAHGNDNQRGRFAAGLLPEQEVLDGLRERVFVKLGDFGRYKRLSAADVYASLGDACYGDEACEFASDKADNATAEEFDVLDDIRRIIQSNHPEAVVEMVNAVGGLKSSSNWTVSRKSVKVTVTVGAFTLSRQFACGE